jgi:hypothetical protein
MIEIDATYAGLFLLGFGFFTSTIGMFIGWHLGGGDGRRPQ